MINRLLKAILILFITLSNSLFSQNSPEKAARFDDRRFILRIDLSWSEEQKLKLAELYNLDSILVKNIFENNVALINDSTEWKAMITKPGIIEISKDLNESYGAWNSKIILSDIISASGFLSQPVYIAPPAFGINDFARYDVFNCDNGRGCFYLPGYQNAKSVYLAGSFNQWSTMQLPMLRDGNGWKACVDLYPGKFLYKFIADGRWLSDPNNHYRENDGHHGYNSVVFCYNYKFSLDGFTKARRVFVAGSFNSWNPKTIKMIKTNSGWELPLFLHEGTHTYKFIVDGQWITDPGNPRTRDDGRGNINSLLELGEPHIFRLRQYETANHVILTGSFNGWNTGEVKMEKANTEWMFPYVLAAGNYEYKFIADGQWLHDPDNPFTTGSGDYINSFIAIKPNHLFVLKGFTDAANVIVSGSFNGWKTGDYRMVFRDSEWIFPIHLWPGKHIYKFIVDGEWILDPENPLWEDNEYGNGNSVLWIDY